MICIKWRQNSLTTTMPLATNVDYQECVYEVINLPDPRNSERMFTCLNSITCCFKDSVIIISEQNPRKIKNCNTLSANSQHDAQTTLSSTEQCNRTLRITQYKECRTGDSRSRTYCECEYVPITPFLDNFP